MTATPQIDQQLPDNYKFGWTDTDAVYRNVKKKGLSEDVVREISQTYKSEPDWMLQRRLKALKHYRARSMPTWGADLSGIDFEDIYYYLRASDKSVKDWNDVPDYIKRRLTRRSQLMAMYQNFIIIEVWYSTIWASVIQHCLR